MNMNASRASLSFPSFQSFNVHSSKGIRIAWTAKGKAEAGRQSRVGSLSLSARCLLLSRLRESHVQSPPSELPVGLHVPSDSMSASFVDPRESSEYITRLATHVHVDELAVARVAGELLRSEGSLSPESWRRHELHPQEADDRAIEWIFLIDSLNFSFWSDGEAKYSVNGFTVYWSLCAAVNRCLSRSRAAGDRHDLTDARTYSQVTLSEMERIFEGDSHSIKLPLLQERTEILRQNGCILLQVGADWTLFRHYDSQATASRASETGNKRARDAFTLRGLSPDAGRHLPLSLSLSLSLSLALTHPVFLTHTVRLTFTQDVISFADPDPCCILSLSASLSHDASFRNSVESSRTASPAPVDQQQLCCDW